MDETALLVATVAVFGWSVVSARLQRADLTAPLVFVVLGAVLAAAGVIQAPTAPETAKPLVEIALVWVLFSDAARVRIGDLRRDLAVDGRLLAVGLPLTVLAGWGTALWLLPQLDGWLALLVAAALAPTDAALGLPVVTNENVPDDVRRILVVESGLNDGIVTPVVVLALAGAAATEGVHGVPRLAEALAELVVGTAIGAAVGAGGGVLLRLTRRLGWAAESFSGVAVLALALASYPAAVVAHGNGFVAAFCAGLAFGATAGPRGPAELGFLEQASGLLTLLVWLAFGAIAVPIVGDHLSAPVVLCALLSLTVVRMVPVGIALFGAGLGRATVLFIGWFGPRGLASVVFGLLALEELGHAADEAVAVITLTVLVSVFAHGLSAAPLANRVGRHARAPRRRPGVTG